MNSNVKVIGLCGAAGVLLLSNGASADILYASTGNINDLGGGMVYRIDTEKQSVDFVSDTGMDKTGGLVFDHQGVLYVVANGSIGPPVLLTVDIDDGTPTVLGTVTGIQAVDALAFDADGGLWGGGYEAGIGSGVLVSIDLNSLAVVDFIVMDGTGNNYCAGLAFHDDGTLFGSRGNAAGHLEDLVTIDLATGVHTPIGGVEVITSDIAFGESGTLYGGSPDGSVFSIDPETGDKTFLFNALGIRISGLAAGPAAGCAADCDGNGELNILDFVCFQGLFQDGDDAADCNGDGVLNILDFVCFQGEFQAGCP